MQDLHGNQPKGCVHLVYLLASIRPALACGFLDPFHARQACTTPGQMNHLHMAVLLHCRDVNLRLRRDVSGQYPTLMERNQSHRVHIPIVGRFQDEHRYHSRHRALSSQVPGETSANPAISSPDSSAQKACHTGLRLFDTDLHSLLFLM